MNIVWKMVGAALLLTSGLVSALAASGGRWESGTLRTYFVQQSTAGSETSRDDLSPHQPERHREREKWPESQGDGSPRESGSSNSGQEAVRRQGKMSPEERRALRKQIDEAGQDIYTQKR